MKKIGIGIFCILVLSNICHAQLTKEELMDLAHEYAPQFRFFYENPFRNRIFNKKVEEHYFPSKVEWYLNKVQLRGVNGGLKKNVGELIDEHLEEGQKDYYLDIVDQATKWGQYDSMRCYVQIRRSRSRKYPFYSNDYDIQYWLFYPFNGSTAQLGNTTSVGEHEGDWEHISIKVDGITGERKKVYFGSHGSEGRWHHMNEVEWAGVGGGPRLVVYSAVYSHANYAYAGYIQRPGPKSGSSSLLKDFTSAEGIEKGYAFHFNSWKDLEFISININGNEEVQNQPNWVSWEGKWGDDGPQGPRHQGKWGKSGEVADWRGQHIYTSVDFYSGLDAMYENKSWWFELRDTWPDHLMDYTNDATSMRIYSAKQGVTIKICGDNCDIYTKVLIKKDIEDEVIRIIDPTIEIETQYYDIVNTGGLTPADMGNVYYEHPKTMEVVRNVYQGTDYHWAENELKASNVISEGAEANYESRDRLILTSGFHAKNGSDFSAVINDPISAAGARGDFDNSAQEFEFESAKILKPVVSTEQLIIRQFDNVVWPNPFTQSTNLRISDEHSVNRVVVQDMSGKTISEYSILQNQNELTLELNKLERGIYLLVGHHNDQKVFSEKIVKE